MTRSAVPFLTVHDLNVTFRYRGRRQLAVAGIEWQLEPGGTLAIVGESGAGKSTCCRALLGLLPRSASVRGSVRLDGIEQLARDAGAPRAIQSGQIAIVPQDPGRGLNPIMRIGAQVAEAVRVRRRLDRRAARQCAIELLRQVRLRAPEQLYDCYPHQLSGGMRHRVLLAMALAGEPRLLIADEATKSLDATTQQHILALLRMLQRERALALVLVSHDLRLAASHADDVLVLRDGRVIEYGPVARVFARPRAAYTRALLDADPRGAMRCVMPARLPATMPPLLEVRSLAQEYRVRGKQVRALDGVSFTLAAGETLGLVGETGSGKSTLARALVQLPRPSAGAVLLHGTDLTQLRGRQMRAARRPMQLVFQDPFTSLDPAWQVGAIVEEPLRAMATDRATRRRIADELLDRVGLPPASYRHRRPHELSGGQCQRVAIARAIAPRPRMLICDEAVSSLDALVQARVMTLFEELRDELGLSFLFIAHDLALVLRFCDRIAVLYRGRLCEEGPTSELGLHPAHPYTAALLAAATGDAIASNQAHAVLPDEFPTGTSAIAGCPYLPQCPRAKPRCAHEMPVSHSIATDHRVTCHVPDGGG